MLDSTIDSYLRIKKKEYVYGIDDNDNVYLLDLKTGKSIDRISENSFYFHSYDSIFVTATVSKKGKKYMSKKAYNMISNKELVFDGDRIDFITAYTSYFTTKKDGVIDYYNFDMKKIYTVEEN